MGFKDSTTRRRVLTVISSLSTGTVAGCTGDSDDGGSSGDDIQDSDGDGVIDSEDYAPQDPLVQAKSDIQNTETPEIQTEERTEQSVEDLDILQEVNPVVTEINHPEPRAVSVDNEHQQNNWYEFQAEIENTGDAGDIGITLVLLKDPNDDPYAIGSKKLQSQSFYFSARERRSVVMNGEIEDGYNGYGFRLWAAEFHATVENNGGEGSVEVSLLNEGAIAGSDAVIEKQTIEMEEDEVRTVTFEGNYDNFLLEDAKIEASKAQ